VSLYTMKQFRDVANPDNACYQAVVCVPRILDEVMNLQEMEQPMTVRIHEFPTEPIVATLGLVGKLVRDDGAGMVYAMQPVRPFSLNATMDEELGVRLMSRAGKLDWTYIAEGGKPVLTTDPFGGVNPAAEKILNEGDPRRLEKIVRMPRIVPTSGMRAVQPSRPLLDDARATIEAIDPQMIVESILSREWGNWDVNARWRKGLRTIAAAFNDQIAGVDGSHLLAAQKGFYQEVLRQCQLPLGGRPMGHAAKMIERAIELESWNVELDTPWSSLVDWAVEREYASLYPPEQRPPKPSPETMIATIKQFLACLAAIATLDIDGVPGTPDRSIDGAAAANEDRLSYLLGNVLSEIGLVARRAEEGGLRAEDMHVVGSEAFRLRRECKEAVALARQRVELQRQAVFNRLAKAAQKPDFCVRRDAAGPDRDRLFPLAESWDEDWYYGPRLLDTEDPAE